MKFAADLHLHSKYSRAVSAEMNFENMAKWARLKGINVLATADFTHPFWFHQLKTELEEAGNGLYKLKQLAESEVFFLLSTEVSSIYSQGGKLRRIHNLIFAPSLEVVGKINNEFLRRGVNLRSDGRPIMGISARDLAELVLSIDESCLIIPAHAWTPWFSVFGSESGFDSLSECFQDLAKYIFAIETGLSSDPAMNWRIEELDNRTILSFSDSHSLPNIGRELTIFEADEISYRSIYQAIAGYSQAPTQSLESGRFLARDQMSFQSTKGPSPSANGVITRSKAPRLSRYATNEKISNYPKISMTVEFFPEEGKYHFTGHRVCGVSHSPQDSAKLGTQCPVCGKKLTVGVMQRVEELADRPEEELKLVRGDLIKSQRFPDRPAYKTLVPLREILAEALEVGKSSKSVLDLYNQLIDHCGTELAILLKTDLGELTKFASDRVAQGIEKVRRGDLHIEPGFDGEYGKVQIWQKEATEKKEEDKKQMSLFV